MPSAATKKPRRAAALPPHERRAAIVEATRPLLVTYGEKVTSRQIAEAAGVAEGTIWSVFTDKDELLTETLAAIIDRADFEQALTDIDPEGSFDEQLEHAVQILSLRVVNIWNLLSSVGPTLREKVARPVPESPALVALFGRQTNQVALTPKSAARLLQALTVSLTHPMVGGEATAPDEIVNFFLNGARHRDPAHPRNEKATS